MKVRYITATTAWNNLGVYRMCQKDLDVSAVSYTHLDVYKRQMWTA